MKKKENGESTTGSNDSGSPNKKRPRGFYSEDISKFKDQSPEYYPDSTAKVFWFLAKISLAFVSFQYTRALFQSAFIGVMVVLAETLLYQHVVVLVGMILKKIAPGYFSYGDLHKMDAMDAGCFLSNKESHVNYMNVTLQDIECAEAAFVKFGNLSDQHPKMRYKVKEICGDYYYEEMTKEEMVSKCFLKPETPDKVLRNQNDIDQYIRDNMNIKCPLDGPVWRVYAQDYSPEDQEDLPTELKTKGMCILKAHHSFCDGVSIMCLTLSLAGTEYGRDYFIKSEDSTWYQELAVKLLWPLQVPMIAMKNFFAIPDNNFITKKRVKLAGKPNVHTSKLIDFRLLKALSKKINVAINDIVMSSLSTALHKMFKDAGDPSSEIKISIPANIRFKFYPTPEEVELENKFAALPLTVPLVPTMEQAFPVIKQASKAIKNSFSSFCFVYGTYWIQKRMNMFGPKELLKQAVNIGSQNYTLAFSNTPGPIKPFQYRDHQNRLIRTIQSSTYISLLGKIGVALAAMSFCNSFKVTIAGDDNILNQDEVEKLVGLLHKAIQDQISKHNVTLDTYYAYQKKVEEDKKALSGQRKKEDSEPAKSETKKDK